MKGVVRCVLRIPGWQIEFQTEEKRRNLGAARVRARRYLEVQGEEEEGYPNDIWCRSESPEDSSGTEAPPSSPREVFQPHQGIVVKSHHIVQARSGASVTSVSLPEQATHQTRLRCASEEDRNGQVREKQRQPHQGCVAHMEGRMVIASDISQVVTPCPALCSMSLWSAGK